jgi:transposase
MVAYSIDLRERVLATVDEGKETQEQIARRFRVSSRWIRKLIAQRTATGSIAPKPNGGGRKLLIQGEAAEALRAAIADCPDATLQELREATGFRGCLMTIWRAILRLEITRKKVSAGPRATRPRGDRTAAGVGRMDGSGRPGPVRFPRRESRQDNHDPQAWPCTARRTCS